MLSMDIAKALGVSNSLASMSTKELQEKGFIHVVEWRQSSKNGGNKVYAIGFGESVTKPETRYVRREENVPFTPHPDVAAAWMMTR